MDKGQKARYMLFGAPKLCYSTYALCCVLLADILEFRTLLSNRSLGIPMFYSGPDRDPSFSATDAAALWMH